MDRRPSAGARIVRARKITSLNDLLLACDLVGPHDPSRAKRGFTRSAQTVPARGASVWPLLLCCSVRNRFLLNLRHSTAALLLCLAPLTASEPLKELRIIAPAAPGGGWDQTARAMQQALQRAGLVRIAPVENVPGAAGTIGLARFIGAERGNGDALMVSGLDHARRHRHASLAGVAARRHADCAPHRRIRSHRRAGGVAFPYAARSARRVQDAARVDFVGRRLGRRQRSDSGRSDCRSGRRRAATRQLHCVLRRRRIAVGHPRRTSLGRHQRLRRVRAADRSGTLRALAISSAERLAGHRRADAARAGRRRRVRELALPSWRRRPHRADRQRLDGAVERWSHQRAVARGAGALRLARSLSRRRAVRRGSSTPKKRASRDVLREARHGSATGHAGTSAEPYPLLVLAGAVASSACSWSRRRAPRRGARRLAAHGDRAAGAAGARSRAAPSSLLERGRLRRSRPTVLFWLTARAFDARHPLRDALFAVALSVAAYVLVRPLAQLSLPAGVLARLAVTRRGHAERCATDSRAR